MSATSVETTSNPGTIRLVLGRLLVGAYLCDVTYSAGFRVETTRDRKHASPGSPLVVRITLRSDWRIGDAESWADLLAGSPWEDMGSGENYDPMRAYALVWLSGAQINAVHLTDQGSLTLETSAGRDLWLSGSDAVFEESWIVSVPPGVPGQNDWSVVCSDRGELWCRFPVGALNQERG